ncbi:MAG: hypothetical protein II505_08785, partial [Bacteroidaceae bacterium]|nr:hypothetical protein [Bacteroidaceae bacterium]
VATADGFSCRGQLRTTRAKKKNGFSFTFRSFALPLARGRKWATLGKAKKKSGFSFTFRSFALPLARGRKWAALGKTKKKNVFSFTFRSFALPLQPDYG